MPGDIILLYIHVCYKWRSYDISFLKYKVRQTENFVILGHFLPFQPPGNPENQNFKIGKIPEDITMLHIRTINHTMYGSWDIERNRHIFLSFWTVFCTFTPHPMDPENWNFEKMKKTPKDIIILQMCTINNSHMMYGSRDMECNGQNFFVVLGLFFALLPPKNLKNQNIEKMRKTPEDIIILHMCIINDNYDVGFWNMERNRQNVLSFWTIFCTFTSDNPKNQNFEKMKKLPGDIILFHMCTINDNHMMYGSWDMEHDRQNFLSFWTIFCPFTPLTTQKIKILKKWKKHLEISSFYTSVPKIMIICYTVPEIWCMTDVIVIFHFGLFFALLPP